LAQAFRIETLDRSGRWYLTPGSRSIYDLRIRNDSKNAVDCTLVVEDPTTGVTVEPSSFSLRGHEVRTVTVTFAPDATSVRAHSVLLSLHSDADGATLATFEHPLVVTGGTDCSVAVAYKDAIVEAGELRGFEVACSVRCQSEATSTFQVSFAPHPALSIPSLPPISLEPGQLGEMVIPIRWNRDAKDESGWNHPTLLEVAVPVSNGRRTSRVRWESIELKLEPFLKSKDTPSMSVTVSDGPSSAAPAPSAPEQITESKTPEAAQVHETPKAATQAAAEPTVAQAPAATQPAPAPTGATSTVAQPAPTPVAAPTPVTTLPTAPVMPAAAAASIEPPKMTPGPTPAKPPSSAPVQEKKSSTAIATPAAQPLMLNGHVQLLMLAAPADVKPAAAPYVNGAPVSSRVDVVKPSAAMDATAPTAEAIELPLFPGIVGPQVASTNGKHEAATKAPQPTAPPAAIVQPPPATPAAQPQAASPSAAPSIAAPQPIAKETTPPQAVQPQPVPPQASAPTVQTAPVERAKNEPTPATLIGRVTPTSVPADQPKIEPASATPVGRPEPKPAPTDQPKIEPVAATPIGRPTPTSVPADQPKAAPAAAATQSVQPAPAEQAKVAPAAAATPPVQPAPAEQPKVAPAAAATPSVQPVPAEQPKTPPAIKWTVRPATIDEPKAAAPTTAPAPASPTVTSAGSTTPPPAVDKTTPSTQHTPTVPATTPATKLTPYAPARWDASADAVVPAASVPVAKPEIPAAPQAQAPLVAPPARIIRERQAVEPVRTGRPMPAGLVIGALAVAALVVAGVLIFKPNTPTQAPATTPVAVAPPVVASSTQPASHVQHTVAHQAQKPKVVAVAPTPHATATAAPTATPKPATPKPATPAPATPKPAAQKVVAWHQQAAPRHISRYGQLYQPATGSVVALGGIEAYYGPRGRAVRVLWGAAEQASASVQLIDEHGTTVSSGSVRGSRTSLLLYLPKGFRGPLTVQVSSIGRLGERVAQTTSLSAFGE